MENFLHRLAISPRIVFVVQLIYKPLVHKLDSSQVAKTARENEVLRQDK